MRVSCLQALPARLPGARLHPVPDPWPKQRHNKRRMVSDATLDALAAALGDGAELRLATDDADYLDWMLERATRHPAFAWLARGPEELAEPAGRLAGDALRAEGARRRSSSGVPAVRPAAARCRAVARPFGLRLAGNDYIAQKSPIAPVVDGEFDGGPAAHFFVCSPRCRGCLACTRDVNAGVPGSVQQHRDGHATRSRR